MREVLTNVQLCGRVCLCLCVFIHTIGAPPILRSESSSKDKKNAQNSSDISSMDLFKDLHYKEYLGEVVKELENDPEFKKRMDSASAENYTEFLASSLDMMNHNVRTRLDELKRKEMSRLTRLLAEYDLLTGGDGAHSPTDHRATHMSDAELESMQRVFHTETSPRHVNEANPHRFDAQDIRNLIRAVTEDLERLENAQHRQHKVRRAVEKRHKKQREKQLEKQQQHTDTQQRERDKNDEKDKTSHRKLQHEKIHAPGSEQQMREIWRNSDGFDQEDYDPYKMFLLHDRNSDGFLDRSEVEALLSLDLKKAFEERADKAEAPDKEEMHYEAIRMRRDMMRRVDTDKDERISAQEFRDYEASKQAKQDPDWKTEQEEEENGEPDFSEEEYAQFLREYNHTAFADANALPPPPPSSPAPSQAASPPNVAHPVHPTN